MRRAQANKGRLSPWHGWLAAICLVSTTADAETLQQAWDTALAVDYGLKAVQETRAAAAQQVRAAEAARLPGLAVGAAYTTRDNAPGAVTSIEGTSASFATGERNNRSYNATVTVPLYTSGRISSGIDAAKSSLGAAQSDEMSRLRDLKLLVAEAFVEVLRAERGVDVTDSRVASLEAHLRDVRNRYDQGIVAQNDVLAAEVELADARQTALQDANRLDLARASYNRLLGRPFSEAVKVQELLPEPINEQFETLMTQSLEQRSELASLMQQVQALHRQARGIRAQTRPQVALNGGYDYQENQFQAHEGQWSATLGLQWIIFDGGVVRHQADAAERQAAALQQQYADLAAEIRLQVRQAWLDVQETRMRIVVTKSAIAQAEENLTVNRDRYENGLSTNTEVLDAETLRTRSRNNYSNAIYDAVMATLQLKRAVGEL